MDKMVTTQQFCEALGIERKTLYRYVAKGRLKAHHIGKGWKFREADVEKFLKQTAVGE